MITDRQIKILNSLIQEYIESAEPISSELLKKKCGLSISPATIRNDLQDLTELGYITQPHTSAGRVPTNKGYKYFIEITFTKKERLPNFVVREVENTKRRVEKELQLAQELTRSLEEISSLLNFHHLEEDLMFDVLKIVGSSKTNYSKNVDIIKNLLDNLNDV